MILIRKEVSKWYGKKREMEKTVCVNVQSNLATYECKVIERWGN